MALWLKSNWSSSADKYINAIIEPKPHKNDSFIASFGQKNNTKYSRYGLTLPQINAKQKQNIVKIAEAKTISGCNVRNVYGISCVSSV